MTCRSFITYILTGMALLGTCAHAQKAVLRVTCEGVSAGADISVNGAFKGRCPIDMEIPSGSARLRAVKSVSSDLERVYENDLRVGSGVVQKVEVELGYKRPKAAAIKRWEAAAADGNTEALYQLGFAYRWGTSGTIDYGKSAAYFKRAAAAGHPAAMSSLAWMSADEALIKDLMLKASEKEDPEALDWLAERYDLGSYGFPEDEKKSLTLRLRAIRAGHPGAALHISVYHATDADKVALRKTALRLRQELADTGYMDALKLLADLLRIEALVVKGPEGDAYTKQAETAQRAWIAYLKMGAATGGAAFFNNLAEAYRRDPSLAAEFKRAAQAAEKGAPLSKEALAELLNR